MTNTNTNPQDATTIDQLAEKDAEIAKLKAELAEARSQAGEWSRRCDDQVYRSEKARKALAKGRLVIDLHNDGLKGAIEAAAAKGVTSLGGAVEVIDQIAGYAADLWLAPSSSMKAAREATK